jgi:AcrR family transcriptional regulator
MKRGRYVPEEKRRKDILDAAMVVFSQKGYHEAKMQEIAQQAGIANGTVYRYFPSKFILATEVIGATGASGFIESLEESRREKLGLDQFLKTAAQKYFGNLEERLPLMRFRISEALSHNELGRQYYQKLLHRLISDFASAIGQFQEKGQVREGDPFVFGHIFYGILFGFLYCQELMHGKEITGIKIDKIVDALVDIFLHGVKKEF